MASHPRRNVKACIDCGTPGTPGDGLSMRGLCLDCATSRHAKSFQEMAAKKGPAWDEWKRSMASAISRELADS